MAALGLSLAGWAVNGLRSMWLRPLAEGERQPLFLLAGAVVIAVALALYLSRGEPSEPPVSSAPAQQATPRDDPDAPPAPAVAANAPPRTGLGRRQAGEVERAARRFLAGYLPYAYGRSGKTIECRSAAPALCRELRQDPPRVPAGTSRLRPRIDSLQTEAVSDDAAEVLVSVDDGRRRYAFPLTLERVDGRWRVSGRGA